MQLLELLLQAHASRAQLDSQGASVPEDTLTVYRVQDRVYEQLAGGARPVAWKVGAANAEAEPTIAPILPGRVMRSPASVSAADFHIIGVEAEIAFRYVQGAFEALVAIELCDSRLADWKTAPPLAKLADNQMNWGLVAGSGTSEWQRIDFATQLAELWIGGEQRAEVQGGHPYGNPFRLIPWTRRHLAKRSGEDLREGDVVTTGSWGGMYFANPGDEVIARFPGIGEARVTIAR